MPRGSCPLPWVVHFGVGACHDALEKSSFCVLLCFQSADSDKVLASFDYVVASVHSSFKMTEEEMTKRILKALKNKYVTMIGHLTGRLLLQREGYPVNQTTIINTASEHGKIIEINAHPSRLDLDWRQVKYAITKGVKISINPDAHTISGLSDVRYGINIARKGWCEKKDVLNTLNCKGIEKYLKVKK